jgi:hypothetical protein
MKYAHMALFLSATGLVCVDITDHVDLLSDVEMCYRQV